MNSAKVSFYRNVKHNMEYKYIKIFETPEIKKSGEENATLDFLISSLRGIFFPEGFTEVKAVIQKEGGENEEVILQYPKNFNSGEVIPINGTSTLVTIKNFKEKVKYEFAEYLFNGLQINLVVGIDFTSSNEKSDPTKNLHTKYFR